MNGRGHERRVEEGREKTARGGVGEGGKKNLAHPTALAALRTASPRFVLAITRQGTFPDEGRALARTRSRGVEAPEEEMVSGDRVCPTGDTSDPRAVGREPR